MTKLLIISLCFLCPLWLYSSCRSLSAVALAKADVLVAKRSTKVYVRKIKLFFAKQSQFRKSQMNVNNLLTMNYEQMDTWWSGKKQSQTNPNKANLLNARMNVTVSYTTNYESKPPIRAPKKQSQISKWQKTIQPFLPKRIMKETRFRVPKKQTQTNPIYRGVASGEAGSNLISEAKMLLRMTINPRPNFCGYYADQIGAPNPYDRPEITVTINMVFSPLIFGSSADVLYILIGGVLRLLSDVSVEKWVYGGEMQVSAIIIRPRLVCCKWKLVTRRKRYEDYSNF